MKQSILMALLVAFGLGLSAQSDSTARKKIEIQIEENTFEFDVPKDANLFTVIGFATKEVSEMQASHQRIIATIEEQRAQGNLSDEEAEVLLDQAEESFEESMEQFEDLIDNWADAYSDDAEAWSDQYEDAMEEWAEQVERNAERADSTGVMIMPPMPPMPPMPGMELDSGKKKIIISKEGIIIGENDGDIEIEIEEDEDMDASDFFERFGSKKSKTISRTEDYFDIAFGFNQQLEDGQFLVENEPGELNFWRSTSFNLGLGYKTRIGSPYSKLYIKYGLDFSWHNFRMTGSDVLQVDSARSFFASYGENNVYDKNKYHIAYFNIPLMLQLDFSEAGDRDEKLTLGLGGYGGVRLLMKRELEFDTPIFREVEEKAYDDFFTNQFRYGLMAQVGYGSFKVTASYDLNSFFQDDKGPANYNMANITLGFTL